MPSGKYHRRTAVTRLSLTSEDEQRLREVADEWKDGCQIAADLAWENCYSKSAVEDIAYEPVREQTSLGSQHSILAIRQAGKAIRSCIRRRENGKPVSKPTFTSPTVTFDRRTMTMFPEKEQVSLTTAGDHPRVTAGLVLPEGEGGYQHDYLESDEWEWTESTLTKRDGAWFLHIGFRKERTESESTTENGTVLGVDLGVEQIAVTSTGRFFSAGELNHTRREFDRKKSDLQSHGTRNAHRTLGSVRGRYSEVVKHRLHEVAKGIVEEALKYRCDAIVFEDLTDIRDRLPYASWHNDWAFDRLYQYVEYKAGSVGIDVDTTDPRDTSHRCVECGFVHEDNRPTRDQFECQNCGNRNHADYNAAKNIADVYLRREQQSSRRRSVGQYALKSGTVTPNGGFTPYPDGFEAESTDKPLPQ